MIASDVSGVVIPIVKLMLQAKCQGKEHMIESEIAILSSVEHPHIIQLKEQQLWPLTRLPILQRKQNYQQIELNGRLVFIVTGFDTLNKKKDQGHWIIFRRKFSISLLKSIS